MNCWIDIGESFGHFYFRNGNSTIAKSWLLSSRNAHDFILECLKDLDSPPTDPILISTKWPEKAIESHAGDEIALIVTSGFEDWPRIRQPLKSNRLSKSPRRVSPLLDKAYIFGITERILFDGQVETALDTEELAFLIEKFKLTEINKVAIGLMHSQVNPAHEQKIALALQNAGIDTVCSHQVQIPGNEVARWWRALVNSYVAKTFQSLCEDLEEIQKKKQVTFQFVNSLGELSFNSPQDFIDTNFGQEYFLTHFFEKKPVVYLGLESFQILHFKQESSPWMSPFGPISALRKQSHSFSIQPNTFLETDSWGLVNFSKQCGSYEPGPMFFGRALKPQLADILYLENQNHLDIEPLLPFQKPNQERRILESIMTFHQQDRASVSGVVNLLNQNISSQIAQEIATFTQENEVVVCGAFAPILSQSIQEKLGSSTQLSRGEYEFV